MNIIGFNHYGQPTEENISKPWKSNYSKNSTIFGKHTFLPIDMDQQNNDNTLIIGTSGTGKTYSFVEPNVLQGNANYIIADAKGDILRNTGKSLKKMGYNIQVLNLVDLKHSMTYNPIAYMHSQLDVSGFAHSITTSDINGNITTDSHQDPFWNNAAESLLIALILFIQEFLPKSEQTMATVNKLFNLINQTPDKINDVLYTLSRGELITNYAFSDYDPNDSDDTRTLGDFLFDWVNQQKPNSVAYEMWNKVTGSKGAPRTWSSVIGILGTDLARYSLSEVENLMSSSQINFSSLLKPKNALFILYDDADSSKNFISNTLYAQLFSYLYRAARLTGNKLPIKVRFFLDDFKNIFIPNFDDYLATARSRNISICMMLQDESQLRAKFGANTPSVIGNCASYLLTGTTDLQMAQTASKRFMINPTAIRLKSANKFLLDVGGHTAEVERFDYQKHPNYIPEKLDINANYVTPNLDSAKWPELISILEDLPNYFNNDDDKLDDDFLNSAFA